jgi:hypothetical protein
MGQRRAASSLLVMLPGAHMAPVNFTAHGFLDLLRRCLVDAIAVDLKPDGDRWVAAGADCNRRRQS